MNNFIELISKIGIDKILHFLVGFIITSLFFPFQLYYVLIGLTLSMLLGLIKETYDQIIYDGWSWKDFRFTCYGGFIAFIYYILVV